MSVQIICDRCHNNTQGRFLNADIAIHRGVHGSTFSAIPPASLPWKISWHLCDSCARDLKSFKEPPPQAMEAAA